MKYDMPRACSTHMEMRNVNKFLVHKRKEKRQYNILGRRQEYNIKLGVGETEIRLN